MRRVERRDPLFKTWDQMIQRCVNPKSVSYLYYGARGIAVCPAWMESFEKFRSDMGPRPDGMTLDRIDSEANYEKDNCRWASGSEQAQKRSSTKLTTAAVTEIRRRRANGETLVSIAAAIGVSPSTVCGVAKRHTWKNVE